MFLSLRLCLAISLTFSAASLRADEPRVWADKSLGDLLDIYKHFHSHPELSLFEKETAARLADKLRKAGFEVTSDVGGHGVVGLLRNGAGPCVMFRTDLDALPVEEKTGLVYASSVRVPTAEGGTTGVMHACGHDMHITNVVAAARYMAGHKDRWSGTLMLIGQPAEERGLGAKAMLDDGLFTKFPKPDIALALHCDHRLPTGKVAALAGYILASVDSVDVTIYGKGGHGAYPQNTVDPVVVASHFVVDLQSIIARELKPGAPAVITVGSIHGGTKHNIIGDACKLQLTVRSYSAEVRTHLLEGIRRKAKAAAASARAPEPKVVVGEGMPATFNDHDLTARISSTFRRVLGDENVVDVEPSMGGEDFSLFGLAGVPACMFRLGTIDADRLAGYMRLGQEPPSLHSPLYHPDAESTLRTAITATCSALLELMPPAKSAQIRGREVE